MVKFKDRIVKLARSLGDPFSGCMQDACRLPFREVFAPQGINEGIAQALVRYASDSALHLRKAHQPPGSTRQTTSRRIS